MHAGALALSCLLMVAGQNPSDGWATNQRDLKIPVDTRAWRPETISQLVLYVSGDRGASWQQHTTLKPKFGPGEQDQNMFIFRAAADGEYWCRVAVIDHKGAQEPRDVTKGAPDQKILIDTRPPVLQLLSAQRQGDEVLVDWTVQEDHPDWTTFKLEYRRADDAAGPWSPAPVTPAPKGPARFRVSAAGPLKMRLSMKDVADNVGTSPETDVGGNGIITTNFPVQSVPNPTPEPKQDKKDDAGKAPPVLGHEAPVLPPPPDPVKAGMPTLPKEPAPAVSQPPAPPAPTSVDSLPAQETKPAGRAVASTDTPGPLNPAPTPPAPAGPADAARIPHKVVNRKDVTLEYELSKVGPSGVGKVEVYLTEDDGQHWKLYADEQETRPDAVGRQKRRLPLPGEGVFGIWLVVKSRAGRGKEPPRPGDLPQLRVEVDLTPPVATLYEPVPDTVQRDAVVLSWTAADKHSDRLDKARLPDRPITLEYSPDGKEWVPIAAGIENTGRYSWKVPTGVVQAYLRLRVRDQAGNEAVAVTPRPQVLDLVAPDVRALRIAD